MIKSNRNSIIAVLLFLSFASKAYAELEAADQDALQKTQELLVDPTKRKEAIKDDKAAQKADDYAKSVGGKNTDEIYNISSKVFERLVKKYNGDAGKIQEVLMKAMTNPESFANSEFSPEDIKTLRELAGKVPQPVSGK